MSGRERYDEHVAAAEDEHHRLVSETTVHQTAMVRAEQIHADASADADRMRHEVEDFVDERLAAFEDMLRRTLRTVAGGRDQLHGNPHSDGAPGRAGDRPPLTPLTPNPVDWPVLTGVNGVATPGSDQSTGGPPRWRPAAQRRID